MSAPIYRWAKRRYLPFIREERAQRRAWLRANRWTLRLNALRRKWWAILDVIDQLVWLARRVRR